MSIYLCHDGKEHDVFREVVTEKFAGHITTSRIEEPTKPELDRAYETFRTTQKCTHEYCWDEQAYMYDIRRCAIWGKGMGLI